MAEGHVVWHVPPDEAEQVLRSLPQWLGGEPALQQLSRDVDVHDTLGWRVGGELVGFVTLRQHFPGSAEVHGLAVRPTWQRQGIGRELLRAARAYLLNEGVRVLQAKTIGPSNPDPALASARLFYQGLGFQPLEEFDNTVWPGQQVLLLVARLQ